jgi:NADH-quinone oxidoreductase subunit N
MLGADLTVILPELVLVVFAMGGLLYAVYTRADQLTPQLTWAAVVLFVLCAAYIGLSGDGMRTAFGGTLVDDAFARFAKIAILLSAAAVLAMSQDYVQRRNLGRFEFPVLIVLAVVGMMLMVSSADLIVLYMGLELQSLALYVIASLRRDSVKSTEAGLKYFVLGALSSGLLLYGASLTYGFAGTTAFGGILQATAAPDLPLGIVFGLVLMLAGLAFKVSAAPFHMWTPDVYEGAPTPVTAFLATAPKIAAMALLARLVQDAFGTIPGDWGQVIAVLAVASMFVGAIAAIGQRNIKRLMAYSSIAHMGFAMIGLAAGTADGTAAMLLYMSVYAAMNVGFFAFILSMERDGTPVVQIDALNLFARSAPGKALAAMVLLVSMAGIPPALGFWVKFAVLRAAVEAGMVWLAVAGVLASVIGLFYYLRIVYFMYFGREGVALDSRMSAPQWALMVLASGAMVAGAVNLFGLEPLATAAAQSLVR